MSERVGAALGWAGFFGNLVLNHVNTVVSIAVGIGALVASVYSIVASRRKIRAARAHEEAVCDACNLGESVECPFPKAERPWNCIKNEL